MVGRIKRIDACKVLSSLQALSKFPFTLLMRESGTGTTGSLWDLDRTGTFSGPWLSYVLHRGREKELRIRSTNNY